MPKFPPPKIPDWAAEMGCPPPEADETFHAYVERLGLDFDDLTIDLCERTVDIANIRLASELRRRNPESFERYVNQRSHDSQERYSYRRGETHAGRQ